ncbi:hypothetical protein BASA81_001593 [Batrachochytrium salamandrivorans]|nr:hypothetical protein BASA81_001593 [Batrachochytrium salamandrivorans]
MRKETKRTQVDPGWEEIRNPQIRSRLLYTNPVCLLTTTTQPPDPKLNCMVISWLTCSDNAGGIICSVNSKRHSALALQVPQAKFTLSIPTHPLEQMVLGFGSSSGRDGDKMAGVRTLPTVGEFPPGIDHEHVVAVLGCQVHKLDADSVDGHLVLFARIEFATVRQSHWREGKWLMGNPGLLYFMGTKRFTVMMEKDGGDEKE